MAAGFGGGMGGLRQQCGSVSAMVIVAGIAKGYYDPKDNAASMIRFLITFHPADKRI